MNIEYSCDVRSHGDKQIELKIRYPIPHSGRRKYDLDLFVFSPAQLGLNGNRYGDEDVLNDMKTYTRYTTPTLPLARVVSPSCTTSPVCQIRAHLSEIDNRTDLNPDRILHELRLLSDIFRVETREVRHRIRDEVNEGRTGQAHADRLKNHCTEIEECIRATRDLEELFMQTSIPERLVSAFRWADESISLKAEIEYYKLQLLADRHEELAGIIPDCIQGIKRESKYRAKRGYGSIVTPDDPIANEQVIYRESVLKKWSQSALYLSSAESKAPNRATHITAGIAAAAAMSFAVVATFFAQRLFASYSIPWALLIVVGYIFKDRIKEILRSVLLTFLPRIVADESTRLINPTTGNPVGLSKNLVRFTSPSHIPSGISRLRYSTGNPFVSILPTENIIHIHRRTRLLGRRLTDSESRFESITEILRLSISSWLEEMDDPTKSLFYLSKNKPKSVTTNRVYHFHVVIRLNQPGTKNGGRLFHYSLIMNRDGLLRIESHDVV